MRRAFDSEGQKVYVQFQSEARGVRLRLMIALLAGLARCFDAGTLKATMLDEQCLKETQ